ncbi:MAG TPA: MgtC/SapB family protein [Lacipirellulaceae bacterium]|jgi:putative Mg2+ transporter-C (MgtC) family protein|nr:MgtC/SapB family protein [Lacipirellulaceae bacterium]
MPTSIGWGVVAIRLALTIIAGALIGLNRGEHGRAAGMRTTILVCLAASVSMIQVNLLLMINGKTPESFVVLDLMRLPLGILSGMGFIGGGVILRRGSMLIGVTTAATLWFVTVMGLCFGGGQLGLGVALLVIGLIVLTLLKHVEDRMHRDRRAILSVALSAEGPSEAQIRDRLAGARLTIKSCCAAFSSMHVSLVSKKLRYEVQWRASPNESRLPEVVEAIADLPGVAHVSWRVQT